MNKFTKIALVTAGVFTAGSALAVTTSVDVQGKIVKPISFGTDTPLDFGRIDASRVTESDKIVTIDPDNNVRAGNKLLIASSTPKAGTIEIKGTGGEQVIITVGNFSTITDVVLSAPVCSTAQNSLHTPCESTDDDYVQTLDNEGNLLLKMGLSATITKDAGPADFTGTYDVTVVYK